MAVEKKTRFNVTYLPIALWGVLLIQGFIAALGFTQQLPTEDRYLMTREELLGRIDVMLGGRVAEQSSST